MAAHACFFSCSCALGCGKVQPLHKTLPRCRKQLPWHEEARVLEGKLRLCRGGPLQAAWGMIRVEVAEGHLPYEAGSFTDRRRAVWSWLGHVVNMPLVLAPKLGRFGGRPRLTCAEKLLSDASAMVW